VATREAQREVIFYIDGAHTKDSLSAGVRWAEEQFRTSSANPPSKEAYNRPSAVAGADTPSTHAAPRRLLVFYCSGDRDADQLLAPLLASSQKSACSMSLLPL
jgi:folylpolyglutamate synthase/dihydropteroate synthase